MSGPERWHPSPRRHGHRRRHLWGSSDGGSQAEPQLQEIHSRTRLDVPADDARRSPRPRLLAPPSPSSNGMDPNGLGTATPLRSALSSRSSRRQRHGHGQGSGHGDVAPEPPSLDSRLRFEVDETAQASNWSQRQANTTNNWHEALITSTSVLDELRKQRDLSHSKSLYLFAYDGRIRTFCRYVVSLKSFDIFILIMILLNCASLAATEPLPKNDTSARNDFLEQAELVFVAVFGIEMILKVIAWGFLYCGPESYLRNTWNILDFIIVLLGFIDVAASSANVDVADVKALRAFRVLRPLRLVTSLTSLQVVVNSILRSVPALIHVGFLLVFLIIIYAIIGQNFYQGVLNNKCFTLETDAWNQSFFVEVEGDAGGRVCSTSANGYQCRGEEVCRSSFEGPNDGITTFDNAGLAILTVFQCVTLEGWTEVLYNCQDAVGGSLNWIYFVSLVVLGSFFVLNLVLGVLSGQFTREGERLSARKKFLKRQLRLKVQQDVRHYQEWLTCAEELTFRGSAAPQDSFPMGIRPYDRKEALSTLSRKDHPVVDPTSRKESSLEDDLDDTFDLMVLVRTYSGVVVRIPAEPNTTLGEVRARLQHIRPQYETRMIRASTAKPLKDTMSIAEIGLVLRSESELNDLQNLDPANAKALVKDSVIQLVTGVGQVVRSHWFSHAVSFLVFVNTGILAAQHEGQSRGETRFFNTAEVFFVVVFILEILIKVYGIGFSDYWRSKFNRFDMFVICASVIENIAVSAGGTSVGISVLRSARLLRAFRFTRYWEDMSDLSVALLRSISAIISLLVLLVIFMVIAALLGMQIFGGRFNFNDGETRRTNFDDFWSAMLAVFQVMTGEDWNAIMYDGINAYSTPLISIIYFCVLFVMGNFVLLNVFLAIAVKSLDDARALREQRDFHKAKWEALMTSEPPEPRAFANPTLATPQETHDQAFARNLSADFPYDEGGPDDDEDLPDAEPEPAPEINPHPSLLCLSPDNTFRQWCHRISFDRRFDNLILVLILISSVMLALEDPVDAEADINVQLERADYFFTTVFALEMVMKIVALGLVLVPGSYVRDPWNILDAVVVIGSILSFAFQQSDVSAIRIIRVLRVLRPLRAIKRAAGLRHVVQCMIVSVKTIGNVFIVTFLFQFIFAVIGVQRFKGRFDYCTDPSVRLPTDCVGSFVTFEDGVQVVGDRQWIKPYFNFDNLGKAMTTLFAVATFEGWVGFMFQAIDATEEGMGPIENHRREVGLFFLIYIIVIAFFMVNIFVGYVIVVFSDEGENYYADTDLDTNARKCIEYIIHAKPIKIVQPKYTHQKWLYTIVTNKYFEYVILSAIAANSIFLLLQFEGMSKEYEEVLDNANLFFTVFFAIEAVLKLYAFNPTAYFNDSWNMLDFVIVVGSLVDVGLANSSLNVSFLRLFRVARLLKIISKGQNMKRLLWTFLQSFKALPWVGLLIALLFFVYAVVGMQLLGRTELSGDREINSFNNFRDFPSALLVLFRAATGENWQLMMRDSWLDREQDECQGAPADGGTSTCGSIIAVPFFVSFVVLCSFLILNLFVAVIMDNFDYLTKDDAVLGPHHLPKFVERWSEFDPDATSSIPYEKLIKLLSSENPPLGFGNNCPSRMAYRRLVQMNVPMDSEGLVNFHATLLALVRMRLQVKLSEDGKSWEEVNQDLAVLIKKSWPRTPRSLIRTMLPRKSESNLTVGMIYAVYNLQRIYREKQRSRRLQRSAIPSLHRPLVAGIRDQPLPSAGLHRTVSSEDLIPLAHLEGGSVLNDLALELEITYDSNGDWYDPRAETVI